MNLNKHFFVKLFLILTPAILLTSCGGDDAPYYVVDKVKTPLVQFYAQNNTGTCKSGIFSDSNTWCQQSFLSPNSTGKYVLKILSLAPAGHTLNVKLTQLSKFNISLLANDPGAGARGASYNTASTSILDPSSADTNGDFIFTQNTELTKTITNSDMAIQVTAFNISTPTLQKLISYGTGFGFPGFILKFTVSSPEEDFVDNEFVTFYVLPTSDSDWTKMKNDLSSFAGDSVIDQAKNLATNDTQIKITGITPASDSSINGNADNAFAATIQNNPDSNSSSKVQWYVSSGTIDADQMESMNWNPQKVGTATAFCVVRDLLGGIDTEFASYTAK